MRSWASCRLFTAWKCPRLHLGTLWESLTSTLLQPCILLNMGKWASVRKWYGDEGIGGMKVRKKGMKDKRC